MHMSSTPVLLDADDVFRALPWHLAIATLRQALRDGLDPAGQPVRNSVKTAHGELLIMPAEFGGATGVKVLSVAPENSAHDKPVIQASYVLMDSLTLTPRAIVDGAALTTLRTPSLAAVAVDTLAEESAHRLVVFGAGPQAEGHVHAIRAVRPIDDVRIVARTDRSAQNLVNRLGAQAIAASVGTANDVSDADIVTAATSSAVPLFDSALLPERAVVTAVGSHHPARRELDSALLGRAVVVVEDVATAMREAGDVIIAVADGELTEAELIPIGDLLRNPPRPGSRSGPAVFKSVGQGWQDLVLAQAAYAANS